MFPETPLLCALVYLKGPAPTVIGYALLNLLCVAALSRKAVLRVLLAVRCYYCGYGNVYPSSGLCGYIFIYYKAGLLVSGCMCTYAYNLTQMLTSNKNLPRTKTRLQ